MNLTPNTSPFQMIMTSDAQDAVLKTIEGKYRITEIQSETFMWHIFVTFRQEDPRRDFIVSVSPSGSVKFLLAMAPDIPSTSLKARPLAIEAASALGFPNAVISDRRDIQRGPGRGK